MSEPGTERWRFGTGDAVVASPTVVGGVVYVGSEGGTLHAVDAEHGTERWRFRTDGPVRAAPAVADGDGVGTATGDGTGTGPGDGDGPFPRAAVDDHGRGHAGAVVYVGSGDGHLYAVEPPAAAGESGGDRFPDSLVDRDPTPDAGSGPDSHGRGGRPAGRDRDRGAGRESDPTTRRARDRSGRRPADRPPDPDVPTGSARWRFDAGDGVRSAPTVAGGVVHVGSVDGDLFGVAAGDGERRWTLRTGVPAGGPPAAATASPTVLDGRLYVGSRDALYAVDVAALSAPDRSGSDAPEVTLGADGSAPGDGSAPEDGAPGSAGTGRRSGPDGPGAGGPGDATAPDSGDTDGDESATDDAAPPVERWRVGTAGAVGASPTIADGTVYAGDGDGYVYAVDAETGAGRFQFLTGGPVRSSPTVADGVVYVGSHDGHLYALDADSGAERWRTEVGSVVASSPTVAGGTPGAGAGAGGDPDGTVYVGSADASLFGGRDGALHALDADTGAERWRFEVGGGVLSSPTVVGGVVYVGSEDGHLHAVNADHGASSRGSRVLLGTLGHHGDRVRTDPAGAGGGTGGGAETTDPDHGAAAGAPGRCPVCGSTVPASAASAGYCPSCKADLPGDGD